MLLSWILNSCLVLFVAARTVLCNSVVNHSLICLTISSRKSKLRERCTCFLTSIYLILWLLVFALSWVNLPDMASFIFPVLFMIRHNILVWSLLFYVVWTLCYFAFFFSFPLSWNVKYFLYVCFGATSFLVVPRLSFHFHNYSQTVCQIPCEQNDFIVILRKIKTIV